MISLREARKQSDVGNLVLGLLILAPLSVWAADLSVPNTFTAGTPAVAAEVNDNFNATATAVNSKQDRVSGTCPAGQAIRSVNADGSVVCQQVSFFGGDGSAGDLTVSVAVNWNTTPPDNPSFANVTINSGQTLTVPAGTIIRCTGSFTNNGTIVVLTGATNGGASSFNNVAAPSSGPTSAAHPGDTLKAAVAGDWDNIATTAAKALPGGHSGLGISPAIARTAFGLFRAGGGSGGGAFQAIGNGGGLLSVSCDGPIVNAGAINALGANGSLGNGGGGGGIVILASRTSVNNTAGSITVSGGNGSTTGITFGNGGGGGGGIVIMVAPAAPALGTVLAAAGTGGTGVTTLDQPSRIAGGGGGGSGGSGGIGGSVSAAGVPSSGAAGVPGYSITMTLDPISIAR